MELRRATPADAPAVARIWYPGWCDAHLGNVPQQLVDARPEESFEPRALDHVPHTTVATVNGEVAGFVMVIGAEVEQVYVSAAHRGSGVASALLAAAEQSVAAAGHPVAWLAVVAGNARARRFYERQGWTDEGLFDHRAPHPDGPIPVPAHRYTKPVSRATAR
ncbi:ribosomal protein S18 acetylase RimI-like enzyme [Lentzea atacamensis]|uniref:Ribosomal protein S18 acetylase RimI-like enzyme n=1 Tax=Lentzea atacamensis TaxID=531938 RepID=A0A316INN9_9PSEU|nr:GNAT family N-acetyltransferase [Lentzea atacamensis]PWK88755.1 ribosomal protein S18 acetylase RimI-like enzyme [Lentzea atacamensis]